MDAAAGSRPAEHRWIEQEPDDDRKSGEWQQRHVGAADDHEPDDEDDDTGDRRDAGLEQNRREHDRRVFDAEAPQRNDARRRRPDAARDVLREHREHLGLQRDLIRNPDPVRQEDPHPAEHEDEVVGGDDRRPDREVGEIRVPQQRHGIRPHVPQRPPEREQQNREPDQLERHVDAADPQPAPEGRHDSPDHFFSLRVRPYESSSANGTAAASRRSAVTSGASSDSASTA